MYPYPPRRTHDDEPTMHDFRGVPAHQRPPVEAALLDEPTSEVPVIRPTVATAATIGAPIPGGPVATEPAADHAPAAADQAESGPEPAVVEPDAHETEEPDASLHEDADTPDAYEDEDEPDLAAGEPVDAQADSVGSEPAPEAAETLDAVDATTPAEAPEATAPEAVVTEVAGADAEPAPEAAPEPEPEVAAASEPAAQVLVELDADADADPVSIRPIDWPPALAESGAPAEPAPAWPAAATVDESTEPSVPDTETEPPLQTSDPYAPAGMLADASVRPLATPPVSSAFDAPSDDPPSELGAEAPTDELAEPIAETPAEEVADEEVADEPAAYPVAQEPREAVTADAEPAVPVQPALPARVAGHVPPAPIAIWADGGADRFREQWRGLQVQFFDDPAEAVAGAKALVTDAVQELADTLLATQDSLDPFDRGAPVDTEAMRVAMRRYQEFLERVLAL